MASSYDIRGGIEEVRVFLFYHLVYLFRNDFFSLSGMTPLLAAAVTGHMHIVEYMISSLSLVSRKERIDALELLGATFVDKKRDMLGSFKLWKRAMEERYILKLNKWKNSRNLWLIKFVVKDLIKIKGTSSPGVF